MRTLARDRAVAAVGVLSIALAGAVGCAPSSTPPADVIASVGQEQIRYETFEVYLRDNVGEMSPQLSTRVLSGLLDQFLTERLILLLAKDHDLVTPGSRPREALEALLEAAGPARFSEEEIRAVYEEERERFLRRERVRLRQILTEDREGAREALTELQRGRAFDEVARTHSVDPRGLAGGEQGVFSRDELPPTFADTVFELAPRDISNIIEADYGFHIFQVVEHYPEELAPFEEAAREIRADLEREREEALRDRLIADAWNRYHVIVYPMNLPCRYDGMYGVEENS